MDHEDTTGYQEKMEGKLIKMQADIQHLRGELKERSGDTRIAAEEKLEQLRDKTQQAGAKLQKLKTASGAAWHETKDGLATAWRDIEDSLQKARAAMKER